VSWSIRRAAQADATALANLAEATFRDAFAADNTPQDMDIHCRRHFGPEIQACELADPRMITHLADAGGELIGFGQLRLRQPVACVHSETPAEMHRLYVARPWHGRQVAQQLMQVLLTAAKRDASDRVWLGVWEHNPRAIRFYRKVGFRAAGDHTFPIGNDPQRDIIMVLDLGADRRFP